MEIARTGHHADGRARTGHSGLEAPSTGHHAFGKAARTKLLKQETTRSARRSHQMALCAIKATPASALPTATCGYVGDPRISLPQICGRRGKCYSKVNGKKGKMQKTKNKGCAT